LGLNSASGHSRNFTVDKQPENAYTFIMTVTIQVIRDGALSLLSDMERLGLIRVNNPSNTNTVAGKKLSQQFAGALRLSDATYEAHQNSLRESRNEWTRNIY
jgi:hypothetical protein